MRIFGFLNLILVFNLYSQDLGEIQIYNSENSELIYNQINCIEFDDENRIWIGTQNGLSIFDQTNNTWDNIYQATENSPTPWSCLPTNVITALEWDQFSTPKKMFIGTESGITDVYWESGQFGNQGQQAAWCPAFGTSCSANSGFIKSLLHNNTESQIWVGSTDGLCVEGLGGEGDWLLQNTENGFYSNNITSLRQNLNNNMIAIGTMNGGLVTYDGKFNIYYSSNSTILDNTVLDANFDTENNIIICTPQAGLGVLTNNGSWIWLNTINSSIPTNSLKNIIIDDNNDLWITTLENGLIHYKDNIFYNYSTTNSNLPDNKINCLLFDDDNNLWLGTDSEGLVKINNPTANINEKDEDGGIVYPSIFKTTVFVDLPKLSRVKILNTQGKQIYNKNLSKGLHEITLKNIQNGIYFVQIFSEKLSNWKIIKY